MQIQKNTTYAALSTALIGWIFLCSAYSCNQRKETNDLGKAADIIRNHAVNANPALKGKKLRVSLSIDGGLEVGQGCMCLKVCDANGQNCTPCTCDPSNCGSCD